MFARHSYAWIANEVDVAIAFFFHNLRVAGLDASMTIMFMIGPCLGAIPRPPKGLIYFQLLSSIITNIFFQQNFFSKNVTFHHVFFYLCFMDSRVKIVSLAKGHISVGEGDEYDSLSKKPYLILK